ncbi:uncharacterized protein LOC129916356 [Episyrphus balteatus]|uniref:uncharacterized protein LOC129916356 n=1 Tax=Episyrphus balteatus TaxID=286459 RepID=UPI002486A307|nr:uncharacterized protein LOC129916356 [Episyrphus balteatus]
MFVNIFGTLLLLGFFSIQLSNSLECYSCNSPQSCRSPGKTTCSNSTANATIAHLQQNFVGNFNNQTSRDYKCISQNYTSLYSNITYKGCVYNRVEVCNLSPKNTALKRQKCVQCSSKLCNPAGTFSSSVLTVFVSLFVVTVYKVLNL